MQKAPQTRYSFRLLDGSLMMTNLTMGLLGEYFNGSNS